MIDNHTVVITGVCGELGRPMAAEFIKRNFKVIGLDINKEGLAALESKWPNSFVSVEINLANTSAFETFLEDFIQTHTLPHIWINNAGLSHVGPLESFSPEQVKLQMDLHFFALAEFARLVVPKMEERGEGIFVNMASTAGHVPCPYLSTYCASKHAVVGLTKSMQIEHSFRKSPVKICLISPGFLDSSILQKGAQYGFPEKFSFLLEDVNKCVEKIVPKILKGDSFIDPTLNGKLFRVGQMLAPSLVKLSSKAAAAKNIRQFFGRDKIG